ncbi:MAG TPA: hypothetical protein VGZ02_10100 [Candidatus Baltobacteraceae bacterium]|nr:hypothetical protein [Candidatus Baltobacteraceae bacterium]
MNRVVSAALFGASIFFLCAGAASATTEFCPARVVMHAAGADASATGPADTYGLELTALGPRQVMAQIGFDTDAGWFTVDVPEQTLLRKQRQYNGPSASFMKDEWVSPMFHVRFPRPVNVAGAWVTSATSTGDGFGWAQEGIVECLPPGDVGDVKELKASRGPSRSDITVDLKDIDPLWRAPAAGETVLAAKSSAPLASTSCAQPFRPVEIARQQPPDFPDAVREDPNVAPMSTVLVLVAINADGGLSDAWVWGPSGYSLLDNAALTAATHSTYTGAIAYCQQVPAMFQFKVTFMPN